MPQVAAAVAALDPARLRAGERVGVNFDGQEHEIGPEDVTLVLQPLEGYQVERAGTHAVALNLELDDDLRREGWARDAVRAIQNHRKASGLNVEDRIVLTLGGDEELLDAVRRHQDYVAGEVLATDVRYDATSASSAHRLGPCVHRFEPPRSPSRWQRRAPRRRPRSSSPTRVRSRTSRS